MNNEQQQPTRQQMEYAAKEITASIEALAETIEFKKLKRRSIVLQAKADVGLIDIEVEAIEKQIEQMHALQEQNNANIKSLGMSGLVLQPPPGLKVKH